MSVNPERRTHVGNSWYSKLDELTKIRVRGKVRVNPQRRTTWYPQLDDMTKTRREKSAQILSGAHSRYSQLEDVEKLPDVNT